MNGHPESNDPSIHIERSGGGPAEILLIHGLGSRSTDFSRLISRMDSDRSIVAPDLRGHGSSDACLPVTVEDFASDLVPLLDEEGPVLVAGFSFGCWVAIELWRRRPGAVSGLVLVDPPLIYGPLIEWASGRGNAGQKVRSALKSVVHFLGLESPARHLVGPETDVIEKMTAIYHASELDEVICLMRENPLTGDLEEADLVSNASSLMAADRPTLLAGLELTGRPGEPRRPEASDIEPVVLFGETSPVTDRASARAFARQIGGREAPYRGGHAAHLETPDEIAAAIESTFDETAGRRNGPTVGPNRRPG